MRLANCERAIALASMVALATAGTGAALVSGPTSRTRPLSHSIADFFTPEKAAYCKTYFPLEGEPPFESPEFDCWTPNDGFTVWMYPRTRVKKAYEKARKWWYPRSIRRLRFGQSWWTNTDGETGTGSPKGDVLYRCTSRASGLTCRNKAGHGWWLGRFRGYRLF